MTSHNGKKLKTHSECYQAGFNDAFNILAQKWKEIGFNQGWMEAQKIYEKEIAALQRKLDAIEAEQQSELDALDAWSDQEAAKLQALNS